MLFLFSKPFNTKLRGFSFNLKINPVLNLTMGVLISSLLLSCSAPNSEDNSGQIKKPEHLGEMQLGYYPSLPDSVEGKITLQPSKSSGLQFQIQNNPMIIPDLTPDSSVGVEVLFTDQRDRIWYRGDTLIEIKAGERTSIEMSLAPQFKALSVNIPLGYGNPLGITQGSLILISDIDTMNYQLSVEGAQYGLIEIPQLFLNAEYSWKMQLKDSESNLLFEDVRTFIGSDLTDSTYVFHLKSLFAELGISLYLPDPDQVLFKYKFQNREVRQPVFQEIRITELMPNPKSSGDDWEWIELYSQSIDTLSLDSCFFSRTLESSSGSALSTPLSAKIPPYSYISLGRDSAQADFVYSGLTLLNSGQSLILSCQGVVIDSIDYSQDSFGDYLNSGYSLALKTDELSWDSPLDSASWCNENQEYLLGDFAFKGTPGQANRCE